MFTFEKQSELGKITISSLVTCIYLPSIVTVISYRGLLYTVGSATSFYILAIIFVCELLKSLYLSENHVPNKKNRNKIGDMIKSFVFLLGVMFCYFVGVILFGAPVLECHEQTIMLSALLTLLTLFPLVAHCGVGSAMQLLFGIKLYGKNTVSEMLVNNAMLTICGAWLGAVVIPLDWNTPWQVWPIPCYLGALGGFLMSNVLSVTKVSLMNAAHKYPTLEIFVNILNRISK